MNIQPHLVRKREAARFLSMPVSTVEKQTAARTIPHLKIGSSVYYDVTELKRWTETKKVPVTGESD